MKRSSVHGALIAMIVAPSLYVARFGYRFGASDQDEFLPWLLARLDTGLLRADWFVGVQESGFNVRSGFVELLTPLARVSSPEWAVAGLFVLSWVLLAWAVFDVSRALTGNPVPAIAAAVLALAVLPRWTLGGNALGSSMLVPSLTGWALSLAGMAFFLRRRPLAAAVCVGAAAWIQLLSGFHAGVAIAAGGVLMAVVDRKWLGRLVLFSVVSTALALPVVLAIVDAAAPVVVTAGDPDLFALLAWFRAPHHYAPAAFPAADRLQFTILAVLGVAALVLGRRDREHTASAFAAGVLAAAGIAVSGGWLAGGSSALASVALLQPFQQTMLVLVMASALGASASWRLLSRVGSRIERHALSAGGVAAAVVLAAALLTVWPIRRPIPGTIDAVAEWARTNAPPEALFALPPSVTGFAYGSERSVLVSFKAVAFSEADLRAWHRRLLDAAPNAAAVPTSLPEAAVEGSGALLARLDADWEARQVADLDTLARRYGVTHFVRSTALPGAEPGFSLLALRHGYRVYGWNGPRVRRGARNGEQDPSTGIAPDLLQERRVQVP